MKISIKIQFYQFQAALIQSLPLIIDFHAQHKMDEICSTEITQDIKICVAVCMMTMKMALRRGFSFFGGNQ